MTFKCRVAENHAVTGAVLAMNLLGYPALYGATIAMAVEDRDEKWLLSERALPYLDYFNLDQPVFVQRCRQRWASAKQQQAWERWLPRVRTWMAHIRAGISPADAALMVGKHYCTLHNWRKELEAMGKEL